MSDIKFVTIDLSKKQIDLEHPIHNNKNNKDYVKVFTPGHGVLFYPAESIKFKKNDENRAYFSRPEGTELQIHYSIKKENVPNDAPIEEKYEQRVKTVKIEELYEMYEEERKAFKERREVEEAMGTSTFINMEVPTSWGKRFKADNGKEYVSISIPIKETDIHYYSFVVLAENFKKSENDKNMSRFGFPRKKQGNNTEDYMITLKRSEKSVEEDCYIDIELEVSTTELKEYIESAKQKMETKDLFIGIEISEKLVRNFKSNEGKDLVSVSIPVYEKSNDEKATFYQIVLSPERIKESTKEGIVYLSLFKKDGEGKEYSFDAQKSVQNPETKQYEKISKKMTSLDVINHFKKSKEKYAKEQSNTPLHTAASEIHKNAKRKGR